MISRVAYSYRLLFDTFSMWTTRAFWYNLIQVLSSQYPIQYMNELSCVLLLPQSTGMKMKYKGSWSSSTNNTGLRCKTMSDMGGLLIDNVMIILLLDLESCFLLLSLAITPAITEIRLSVLWWLLCSTGCAWLGRKGLAVLASLILLDQYH